MPEPDALDSSLANAMPPYFFIDSHCHFDFSDFDGEREKVWRESNKRGVLAAVIPGVALEQWARAKKICKTFNGVYFSAGVHPWWVGQLFPEGDLDEAFLAQIYEKHKKVLASKKCVAIGECGLDKMINAPVDHQFAVFDYQVKLAAELKLPLILHARKTHNEVMKHIDNADVTSGGVIHAFSGSVEIAKQYIERGFYIGVGGTITYERAKKTQDAIRNIPIENIVLETDAPDMPIHGKQGQRNSPEYLPEIAAALAALKNMSVEEVAQKTTENTCRLFNLKSENFSQ